ncbi:MAG: hypothetical protein ABEJ70_06955 [Halobacteriaceae archaeon]
MRAVSSMRARRLVRLLQVGVLVVLLWSVSTRNVRVATNALLGLVVTLLPGALTRDVRETLEPGLSTWVASVVFLHALGMVTLYESVWWWDHLTHALSSALVAVAGYVTVRTVQASTPSLSVPRRLVAVFVVLVTLAIGVGWELLEFGGRWVAATVGTDPVLVQYGVSDTMLDLVFDVLGALVAAALVTPRADALVDRLVDALEARPGR